MQALKSGRFLYAGFYCIMNEAISVCRFLKVKGSYMWVYTVQRMMQFQPVGSYKWKVLMCGFLLYNE